MQENSDFQPSNQADKKANPSSEILLDGPDLGDAVQVSRPSITHSEEQKVRE